MSAPTDARAGMPAALLAAAVREDAQFQLPARPRLCPSVVAVSTGDGVLLEGGPERKRLRGRSAATLLPRLLPLLDGRRDADELAACLGDAPRAAVEAALAALYSCGVIDDGDDGAAAHPGPDAEAAGFLARMVDSTRVNRSFEGITRRLAGGLVAVDGPADAVESLAAQLRACGVATTSELRHANLVVALVEGADDQAALTRLDADCAARGAEWLRVAVHRDGVELGPLFDHHNGACYRCFASGREPAEPPPAGDRAWIALAAIEVVNLLGRVGHAASATGVAVWSRADWSRRSCTVPRLPGCPVCLPGTPPEALHPAYAYEQAVAFPPRRLLNPKDHQHHYKLANLALQRDAKQYPSARRVDLPGDRAPAGGFRATLAAGHSRPAAELTLATLSGLLRRTFGLRPEANAGGKLQRWAPTGGNLGSVQGYVLAHGVTGLAPGAYYYDAREHELAVLGEPGEPAPGATVVLTAALLRVGHKYGDLAYRLVHADAGVAVTQLLALARAYGLRADVVESAAPGPVATALGIDPVQEPVTAVITLRGAVHAH